MTITGIWTIDEDLVDFWYVLVPVVTGQSLDMILKSELAQYFLFDHYFGCIAENNKDKRIQLKKKWINNLMLRDIWCLCHS